MPRGMAAGYTMHLPEEYRMHMSRRQMFEELVVLLAGRVAEETALDDICTGASNDIERATQTARDRVTPGSYTHLADVNVLFNPQMQNLPYSLEAEQSILGGILLEPETVSEVMEYITRPEMFYRKQHQGLFSVLINMFNINRTIDFVTVLDEVDRAGIFDSPENAKGYLVQLMGLVPTTANILDYCRIVQEKYYIRTLMLACTEVISKANDGDVDARQLLDLAEQKIYDIRQGKDASAMEKIDTVIIAAYDRLLKLTGENKEEYEGLRTGFSRLDMLTAGLNKSDLILIAARPGMGKSSFAMNIAINVAKRYNREVAIFSLEMSNEQLILRALA